MRPVAPALPFPLILMKGAMQGCGPARAVVPFLSVPPSIGKCAFQENAAPQGPATRERAGWAPGFIASEIMEILCSPAGTSSTVCACKNFSSSSSPFIGIWQQGGGTSNGHLFSPLATLRQPALSHRGQLMSCAKVREESGSTFGVDAAIFPTFRATRTNGGAPGDDGSKGF